ncbi:MAG: hypothetical protein DMG58_09050 [Acidobacteria bacterium]|nr:MAG: hypothetical protein DMG58_09050 [Acidobacteriota bacterium]
MAAPAISGIAGRLGLRNAHQLLVCVRRALAGHSAPFSIQLRRISISAESSWPVGGMATFPICDTA